MFLLHMLVMDHMLVWEMAKVQASQTHLSMVQELFSDSELDLGVTDLANKSVIKLPVKSK